MITEREKDIFWGIVAECLVRFFDLGRQEASSKSAELRDRIEPDGASNEMVYHADPLDIAGDLAEASEVEASKKVTRIRRYHGDEYLTLLASFGREPAQHLGRRARP